MIHINMVSGFALKFLEVHAIGIANRRFWVPWLLPVHMVLTKGAALNARIMIGVIAAFVSVTQVNADCIKDQYGNVVCGKGQCATDTYGKVFCAQLGGGALQDGYGSVKCGVGNCERDAHGEVWCSIEQGGGASVDSYGKVVCQARCEAGTPQRCQGAR